MPSATGEVPHEPGVDRTEQHLAGLCALSQFIVTVEQPGDFGSREVGIGNEASELLIAVSHAAGGDLIDQRRGLATLPDNRGSNGLTSQAIPENRGFSLIGDPDGGDLVEP